MSFEELWEEVKGIPNTAKLQIPEVLKEETKRKLSLMKPERIASIIMECIEEVNHGSVEKVDALVNKKLLNMEDR